MMMRVRDSLKAYRSHDALDLSTWIAVAYIMVPVLLFLLTWTKLLIGLPLTAAGLWILIESFPRGTWSRHSFRHRVKNAATPAVFATIWVATTGLWGMGFGRSDDWAQYRDDLLSTLFAHSWPITHVFEGSPDLFVMRHYLAYYLPGPAVAKILGLGQGSVLFFTGLWTWLGVMIVFSLLIKHLATTAKFVWVALLAFIGFSGLDIIGSRIRGRVGLRPATILDGGHIEWWAQAFQYSSNTTLLHWVPQHALSGWIGALVIIRVRRSNSLLRIAPLLISSTLLWSPFVFFGLCLVFLIHIVRYKADEFSIVTAKSVIPALLFSGVLATLLASYLVSGTSGIPKMFLFSRLSYEKMGYPLEGGLNLTLRNLVLFLLIEVGPYVVFVFLILKHRRTDAMLIGALLTIIPLYIVGHYNDFAMRASVPVLTLLALFAIEALLVTLKERRYRLLGVFLILTFMIGAITPAIEFVTRAKTQPANLSKPCIDTECESQLTSTALRDYNWTTKHPFILRSP